MKRRIPDPILMLITILVIIGFQVYWLKDNYDREKKSLQIKTGVAFQETIEQLQAKKLKLPDVFMRYPYPGNNERVFVEQKESSSKTRISSGHDKVIKTTIKRSGHFQSSKGRVSAVRQQSVFIVMKDSNGAVKMEGNYRFDTSNADEQRRNIVTTMNLLRSRLGDSVKIDTLIDPSFALRIPENSNIAVRRTMPLKVRKYADSGKSFVKMLSDSNNRGLSVLYSVDSLQDSLQLPEITKAYSVALKKLNVAIPFSVIRSNEIKSTDEQDLSAITVGFVKPVTYHLSLGNTVSYLFKKISLPILFSLFLVGVTIFSFVLLYRNLLRQQRLAEIKNEFISNISHELKTPIATVGVAIEALKNFNAIHDTQKTREYLDISSNELQRLGLLVDKVLKLSMFEKKEVELNKENFNMKALTMEVLDTMKIQFDKNKAVVNFATDGNDFIVNADKLHITSVIYNLLDNALKYRKEDPEINVHLSAQQNNIELKVEDNGIGIEPEYQSKIFDKFFRVPTGNKHVVKGYGLGLSYVSHIIAQHKGTIHVESELNKGSTFIIKIPMYGKGKDTVC
ncbi:MAG TPA: HAMP domain-containing sensor histidine kinase [Chitinophagaceae bacterium]|nr:HAMP domain-containing sensor histidine kinase [Chitinophagaceae bacterium]